MKNNNNYFIFGLVLANSLMYVFAFIMMDSARDIFQAMSIVDGSNFPLIGPDIGGFAHVGPIWYYFLAIPVASGSLVVVALWIGFFASLKIFFAYQLGRNILGNDFALLWVTALLLIGWQSITSFFLIHTNVVQTLSLLYLLLLYNFISSNNPKYFIWLLFSLSLAIHAHPSTLILAIFLPFVILKKWEYLNFKVLFIALLLFILPFTPYIYEQITNGFADFYRMANQSDINNQLNIWQRLPNFIVSIFYYGPLQIRNFIYSLNPLLGNLIFALYILILLVSVLGLLLFSLQKKGNGFILFKLIVIFLILCLLVLGLRSFIPFYMMLVLTPFTSGLIALGLWSIVKRVKTSYLIVFAWVIFIINLIPTLTLTLQYQQNQFSIPSSSKIENHVGFSIPDSSFTMDGISVINAKSLQETLCKNVYIHGPFSIVLDYTSAVPLSFYCPQQQIKFGGAPVTNKNHIFIMHQSFWNKISIKPEGYIYQALSFTHNFINHSQSNYWNLAQFDDYIHPQRINIKKNPKAQFYYDFTTKGDSVIVITNLLPTYVTVQLDSIIIVNENQPSLLINNIGNWMYQCNDCNANELIQWQITITSDENNVIDINELTVN